MSSSPLHSAPSTDETGEPRRVSTGIVGLDEILGGGIPTNRLYLIDGEPGTGKTTLALQFLLAGRDAGERTLYVTLSETAEELRAAARSHNWSLEGIDVLELQATPGTEVDEAYTLFHPSEVELQQTVETVLDTVEQRRPSRVVFDSLSEMRMLARDPLRFRRQILALKQFFAGRACTVMVLDDRTGPEGDLQLQSLAHGVIALEYVPREYGAERRRIVVKKMRGTAFRGGHHDIRIRTGGLEVYPRIYYDADAYRGDGGDTLCSGSRELDALLGGGIAQSTSALIAGAAGTGKSVLATQFALAAVERGEKVQMYLFEESNATALARASSLKMDLAGALATGRLSMRQIEPTQMSAGEFGHEVRRAVEEEGVTLIVIDSLNGYVQAMPSEKLLPLQVHELLGYLSSRGVSMLMTLVQRGIFGAPVDDAVEISYLADTVLLLRYFEYAGSVRQAISVVKKRRGDHERTIREYRVGEGGLRVGRPLTHFQGVLTGIPTYTGGGEPLMSEDGGGRPSSADVSNGV